MKKIQIICLLLAVNLLFLMSFKAFEKQQGDKVASATEYTYLMTHFDEVDENEHYILASDIISVDDWRKNEKEIRKLFTKVAYDEYGLKIKENVYLGAQESGRSRNSITEAKQKRDGEIKKLKRDHEELLRKPKVKVYYINLYLLTQ